MAITLNSLISDGSAQFVVKRKFNNDFNSPLICRPENDVYEGGAINLEFPDKQSFIQLDCFGDDSTSQPHSFRVVYYHPIKFPYGTVLLSVNSSALILNNDHCRFVKSVYAVGTNWYRIWSDGWIEQGFRISSGTDVYSSHTFLIPFSNANYTLLSTIQTATNDFNKAQPDWIVAYSSTGFSYHGDSFAGAPFIYACGY